MKGKILFVVGLGVGYVLGTRAGRERYEQISRAAKSVWTAPAVQEGVGAVKEFAASRVGDLSDRVLDGVKSFIGRTVRGSGTTKQDVSSAAKSAKGRVSKSAQAAKSAVDTAAEALDDVIDQAASVASESAADAGDATTDASTKPAAAKAPRSSAKRPTSRGAKPAASDS
jgi:hypothetical protein